MKKVFYKWLTDPYWGFLRFFADGFIGLLFLPIRFLVIFGWFAVGAAIGKKINMLLGINMLFGSVLAFFFILLLLWAISLGWILIFFPFPRCKQNRCRSIEDYTWIMGRIYGYECRKGYYYRCKCNNEYVRKGKRFMHVVDDIEQPYLILESFRNWKIDDQQRIKKK
jgi:hypothetical protein